MNTATAVSAHQASRAAFAIVWGGLACGVLDLTAAFIRWGLRIRIPQTIASGLLGPRSYDGGMATAALGVFLHFFIAFSWATVFYLASRRMQFLLRQYVLSGFIYGTIVYLFMGYVVVPLSAVPSRPAPFSLSSFLIGLVTHWFCVGLPIAVATRVAWRSRL